MLPVVHLIPRLSHLKPKGVHCETLCSATICFDERKMEWVVETPGTLSYVGSPDLQSCTLTRFTIPSDGGSFLLRLSDRKEPRPSIDCECGSFRTSSSKFYSLLFEFKFGQITQMIVFSVIDTNYLLRCITYFAFRVFALEK